MSKALQLMLFADLPVPPSAAPQGPRRLRMCAWRDAVRVLLRLKQQPLVLVLRPLERDLDTEFDYPERRRVRAEDAAPVETAAAPSIFALAAAIGATAKAQGRTRHAPEPAPVRPRIEAQVQRLAGLTRVQGSAYPANRWTPEREEQERIRRAKQRPPRPTGKAKRRSQKLLETIGGNVWED